MTLLLDKKAAMVEVDCRRRSKIPHLKVQHVLWEFVQSSGSIIRPTVRHRNVKHGVELATDTEMSHQSRVNRVVTVFVLVYCWRVATIRRSRDGTHVATPFFLLVL